MNNRKTDPGWAPHDSAASTDGGKRTRAVVGGQEADCTRTGHSFSIREGGRCTRAQFKPPPPPPYLQYDAAVCRAGRQPGVLQRQARHCCVVVPQNAAALQGDSSRGAAEGAHGEGRR